MRDAIPPLSQYAFVAWCSVKKCPGTTLLYFYLSVLGQWLSTFEPWVSLKVWKQYHSCHVLEVIMTSVLQPVGTDHFIHSFLI